jgi:hypothetical protein
MQQPRIAFKKEKKVKIIHLFTQQRTTCGNKTHKGRSVPHKRPRNTTHHPAHTHSSCGYPPYAPHMSRSQQNACIESAITTIWKWLGGCLLHAYCPCAELNCPSSFLPLVRVSRQSACLHRVRDIAPLQMVTRLERVVARQAPATTQHLNAPNQLRTIHGAAQHP